MNENYIVINGKRLELTKKQLKVLGIGTRKPLFDKVDDGGSYYFINCYGDIKEDSREDDALFNNVNYFNDEYFANQVALQQLLYRKLLKFAYDNCDNECEDTAGWNGENCHWSIDYVCTTKDFIVSPHYDCKSQDVYFSSDEVASRAIKEVVEPFIKEHPEFVW